jgi:hypothetical protein
MWASIAALRANKTRGTLVVTEPPEQPKKAAPEPVIAERPYLIKTKIYKALPGECRLRIDYFIDEVFRPLSPRRQNMVRQAFTASKLEELIDPLKTRPLRLYAFFDDVTLAIQNNTPITPNYLKQRYKSIRDAQSLVTTRIHAPPESPLDNLPRPAAKVPRPPPSKPETTSVPDAIKNEVRELLAAGFGKDEIWQEYGKHFASRQQFGAVIAWASPKLAMKRKTVDAT